MSYKINLKSTLLVCLLLLTTSGWCLAQGGAGKTPLKKNSTTSKDPVTADSKPGEVLRRAYGNLLTALSYRSRSVSTSTDGHKSEYFKEFVAPDRFRTVVVEQVPELKGKEVIVYMNRTYSKNKPDSKWESSGIKVDDYGRREWFHNWANVVPDYKNRKFKVVGTEEINGIQTIVYQEDTTHLGEKFWVGVRDYMLYKYETQTPVTNASDGKQIIYKSTWYFYDYDADIKIVPPM